MYREQTKLWNTIFLLVAFLFPQIGFASDDSLLLLVSARHFGTYIDEFGEEVVAKLLVNEFKPASYRRIIVWKETSKLNPLQLLKQLVDTRKPGEHHDIFAIDHGPDASILPGVLRDDVENILPYAYLRRFFSTGCSQWGNLRKNSNEYKVAYASSFPAHLYKLGIAEYIIICQLEWYLA